MLQVHALYPCTTPGLRRSVAVYVCSHDAHAHAPTHAYHFYPSAQTMLVWHGAQRTGARDAHVVVMRPGASLTPCPTAPASVVAVLRPGAARRLLGVPASELPPREVLLQELVPGALTLAEVIARQEEDAARIDVLEEWMVGRLMRTRLGASPCVGLCARLRPGEVDMRALRELVGFSDRQLRNHFVNDLGMAPRRYLRLQRFRLVLGAVGAAPVSWAEVALEHGYYDQSHLIRDFQEFLGHSPEAFRVLLGHSDAMLDGLAVPKASVLSNPS
ncbi:MAG: helix-turn-helix domain-containing protein [Myxococcota bacterium]